MSRVYRVASESSLILYFGEGIDPYIAKEVQHAYSALKKASIKGFYEIIPSYASLMVSYDVLMYGFEDVKALIEGQLQESSPLEVSQQRIVKVPVFYGEEVGLDLALVAEEKAMSVDEVVALHTQGVYSVYAIGFAPGFAYLGQIDERLATARLANPRKEVPKGSVSIADRQTAVYPTKSPGGWKILGRTPVEMFDASYEGLSLVHVGDLVQFEAISKEQFLALGGQL